MRLIGAILRRTPFFGAFCASHGNTRIRLSTCIIFRYAAAPEGDRNILLLFDANFAQTRCIRPLVISVMQLISRSVIDGNGFC